MTSGCVTNGSYVLGTDLTGLNPVVGTAGSTYYAEITANASPGYLVSPTSVQASGVETSQIGAPSNLTVTSTTRGEAMVKFTGSTGTAPLGYTVEACTNQQMTTGCVTQTNYVSNAQLTGLTSRSSYWFQVTAIAPVGYANNSLETNGSTRVM
jgi:hypothetical protein